MSVYSVIMQALAEAHTGVPGIGELMISRKQPLAPDYKPGFVMLELSDIIGDEPTHGEGRIGRNPSSGIQRHDALCTSLISAYSDTPEKDDEFREGVIMGVATKFANSELLRTISHRYWMSRVRFVPVLNGSRPEIQALCEFRVMFKTHPNRPGVAIQTR